MPPLDGNWTDQLVPVTLPNDQPSGEGILGAGGQLIPYAPPTGAPAVSLPSAGVTPEPISIDVSGGKAAPKPADDWTHSLIPVSLPSDPPPGPSTPQMTGLAREAALPASALAGGLVQAAGAPGDIVRAIGALGGAQAAQEMQGNPTGLAPAPLPAATPPPSGTGMLAAPPRFGMPTNAAGLFTPQQLAAAPGKVAITAPTGNNPLSSESLLALTNAAGITNRPDLQPQTPREKMEAAAAGGVGMVLPTALTGGVSDIPAALRLARQGIGMGLGSEAGGDVGQAVGGTPGRVIGAIAGGVAPGGLGMAAGKIAAAARPMIEPTLAGIPLIRTAAQKNMAARTFAAANTPENRAALANPQVLVPGSPPTSFQATGDESLGVAERAVSNQPRYAPMFRARRGLQNRKQTEALANGAGGDVGGIVPWFRGRLAGMQDAEKADTLAYREALEKASATMGAPTTAHEAGGVVRAASEAERAPMVARSDRAIAAVDRIAQHRLAAVGGEVPAGSEERSNALQTYGQHIRKILDDLNERRRQMVSALFDAVDPEGKLVVDMTNIRKGARDIAKDMSPNEEKMEGKEAAIFGTAMMLPKAQPFNDLKALRGRITDALRKELGDNGRTVVYRRLSKLLGAVDDTITNGVERAAAADPGVAERLAQMAREEGTTRAPTIRTVGYERNAADPLAGRIEHLKETLADPNLPDADRRDLSSRVRHFERFITNREAALEGADPAHAAAIRGMALDDIVSGIDQTGREVTGRIGGFGRDDVGAIDTNGIKRNIKVGDIRSVQPASREPANGPIPSGRSGAGNAVSPTVGPAGVPIEGATEGATGQRSGVGGGNSAVAAQASVRVRKPESLIDHIIAKGGMQDPGGDLAAMGADTIHHQGGGRLINPNGRYPDYVREGAVEEGFLKDGADINDLYDAINEHLAGNPRYRLHEQAEGEAWANAQREADRNRVLYDQSMQDVEDHMPPGLRLTDEEMDHAAQMVAEGMAPEDAVREAARAGEEKVLQRHAEANATGAPGVPLAAEQSAMDTEAPQLTPNFDADAAARYRAANAAHRERVETYDEAPGVGDVLAPGQRKGEFKLGDALVPSKVFQRGPNGAETADALLRAAGSPEAALKILGDYPAYSLRAAAEKMGVLSVKDYDKWAAAFGPFLDKFPELKARFDSAAKASSALNDLRVQRAAIDAANPIEAGWDNARIMQEFVKPGPRGYESAGRLLGAIGNRPDAVASIRDYLASSLRDAAEVKTGPRAGTLDPGAYQRWMGNYRSFMSHPAMADARAAFADAGVAQAALDEAAKAHKAAQDAYMKSVAGEFLDNRADPVLSMGKILSQRDPGPDLAALAEHTAHDPVAREALQSAVMQSILDRAKSNNPVGADLAETYLKANDTQNVIGGLVGDSLDGPLRHVLTRAQMEALNNVRLDIRRANLSISGNKAPGGSDTGLITSSHREDAHAPTTIGALAMLETWGEAGKEVLGGKGRALAMVGGVLLQAARRVGFQSVNDLRAEALLHPEKMSALLARLPDTTGMPSRVTAILGQLAALGALSGVKAAQMDQPERRVAR